MADSISRSFKNQVLGIQSIDTLAQEFSGTGSARVLPELDHGANADFTNERTLIV